MVLPNRSEGHWRVCLRDLDTGNILFQVENQGALVTSSKRYYVRFGIEVWDVDEQGRASEVLSHVYQARDQNVLVQMPVGTLGDPIGWLPYAVRFRERHGCRLTCALAPQLISLFRDAYPDIDFVTKEEVQAEQFYATYYIGLFFDDTENIWQPCDFRHVGLHRTAGYILGVDPQEEPPRIAFVDDTRPIADPYVCIATQATAQCKKWNNPYGWSEIIRFLKDAGYRVVCIDRQPVHGQGMVWTHLPHGVEDETGDRPLTERARWLRHAEFFVGLGSGLSWLAWAAGTPVVLISGFSHPTTEFATPYRVVNWHACNSCWNDVRERFDHKDFLWCPRHKDTPRQFECTRLITADAVKAAIARIPGFGRLEAKASSERAQSVHVINLDRSAERLREFAARNRHLVQVKRLSAADGLLQDVPQLIERGVIDESILDTYTAGALGCALSHVSFWDMVIAAGEPLTVCEDDAIFRSHFEFHMARFLDRVPRNWDVILWGWNFDAGLRVDLLPGVSSCAVFCDQDSLRANILRFQTMTQPPQPMRVLHSFGTPCYSLSPKGARALKGFCVPLRELVVPLPEAAPNPDQSKRRLRNVGIDDMMSAAYAKLQAFVSVPPLAVSRNDHTASTVLPGPTLRQTLMETHRLESEGSLGLQFPPARTDR